MKKTALLLVASLFCSYITCNSMTESIETACELLSTKEISEKNTVIPVKKTDNNWLCSDLRQLATLIITWCNGSKKIIN